MPRKKKKMWRKWTRYKQKTLLIFKIHFIVTQSQQCILDLFLFLSLVNRFYLSLSKLITISNCSLACPLPQPITSADSRWRFWHPFVDSLEILSPCLQNKAVLPPPANLVRQPVGPFAQKESFQRCQDSFKAFLQRNCCWLVKRERTL